MTRLLVSVRDADEADVALEGGAHLIDIKEPRRGSLGGADPQVWAQVHERIAARAPLSAALGELLTDSPQEVVSEASDFQYVKVGLSGCANESTWRRRWSDVISSLPLNASPVAVVYADWQSCGAPSPDEVLTVGKELGCRAMLIDTYLKDKDVFGALPIGQAAALLSKGRSLGLATVIAGSLKEKTVPLALSLEPDYVAVRGAVCSPSRTGAIVAEKVGRLATMLAAYRRRA